MKPSLFPILGMWAFMGRVPMVVEVASKVRSFSERVNDNIVEKNLLKIKANDY
jgi:hypothetical protein